MDVRLQQVAGRFYAYYRNSLIMAPAQENRAGVCESIKMSDDIGFFYGQFSDMLI